MLRCLMEQLEPHGGNDPHTFGGSTKAHFDIWEDKETHTLSDPLTDT